MNAIRSDARLAAEKWWHNRGNGKNANDAAYECYVVYENLMDQLSFGAIFTQRVSELERDES